MLRWHRKIRYDMAARLAAPVCDTQISIPPSHVMHVPVVKDAASDTR